MGGMLIDTLAYQFVATWEHRDESYVYYDYLTRDFFQYLAGLDINQMYYWQALGSGSYVYRGAAFQYKARSAELRAREAIAHQAANQNWAARQKYRDIWNSFPRVRGAVMPATTLEGQLREMYGRAAYTHKTHEKMVDQYIARYKFVKVTEIVLSAVASGSFILALLGDSHAGTVVGSIVSAVLLGLTLNFKEATLTENARAYTEVAAKLWAAREALLSLLVDMSDGGNVEHIRAKRNELNASLEAINGAAPRTNSKA